ncbi:histidine kinase [Microbacterium lacticum]|uniref:sensor histidine kinase n=1 Tax=Microbacterium lacticum TaxID=33885 RepID=UPI003A838248
MAWSRLRAVVEGLNTHPRSRDALAAVAYLLFGILLLHFGVYGIWGPATAMPSSGLWSAETAFLVLLILMSALATARSTHPFLVLGVGVPLLAADLIIGSSLGVVLLFADFVYCAFRYGGDRGVRVVLAAIIASCAITTLALLLWPSVDAGAVTLAMQLALIVLIAALWGWNVRSERQRTRAAMTDDHRQATQRLRQEIAHDLHDLVANQIAVAGLNIEAARLRIAQMSEPSDEIDESLAQSALGTDEAHSQLRRLIAVLTTVDDLSPEMATVPGDGQLDTLVPVGRALVRRGAGVHEILDRAPRAAGIMMRVLRELVINAVKHGEGDVILTTKADDSGGVRVQVTNRILAPDRVTPSARAGSGIGITGAALLLNGIDGHLESAATSDGPWHATITIRKEHLV